MKTQAELDHLVWAVPDLDRGILEIERRLGVAPTLGGRHPGVGTRNALVDIAHGRYLEILAPDPDQDTFTGFGRWVAELSAPKLVTWAARTPDLERWRAAAEASELAPGQILDMERRRPDGSALSWRLLALDIDRDGRLPFCIEWQGHHPTDDLPSSGCELAHLRLDAEPSSPSDPPLGEELAALGLEIGGDIELSIQRRGMAAIFDTPRGRVELV